jgi:hypothetical protein
MTTTATKTWTMLDGLMARLNDVLSEEVRVDDANIQPDWDHYVVKVLLTRGVKHATAEAIMLSKTVGDWLDVTDTLLHKIEAIQWSKA